MSTLWTPDGEMPVNRAAVDAEPIQRESARAEGTSRPRTPLHNEDGSPVDADTEEQMEKLRLELLKTPVDVVIANHCFGLFELGALHLSADTPNLAAARTAIDAFAYLVEGLGSRLGDNEGSLKEALSQLRLAFVQINKASGAVTDANG